MNPLPSVIGAATLLFSPVLRVSFLRNLAVQAAIFIPVCQIPAWRTGRMTYVDLAWPAGLVAIGLQTLLGIFDAEKQRNGQLGDVAPLTDAERSQKRWRRLRISLAYLLQGGRMLLGAINLLKAGHLNTEAPRYEFQRLRWATMGITELGSP